MEINEALARLATAIGQESVRSGEPMSHHTTFKVGGPADIFIIPARAEDAALAVKICRAAGVPLLVLGNGSNLLVRDGGIRGAVLHLGERFNAIRVEDATIRAQAGALLSRVAAEAYRHGLAGMEFASGIPGSLGGAAAMNAGAYGGEMKGIVRFVNAVTADGDIEGYTNSGMEYSYRHSRALSEGLLILEVELALRQGDRAASKALLEDYASRRMEKQPLDKPSAGSFFKRPPGHYAGKLIQEAGLMGLSVGGASVSEKHAGFIVNDGNASAGDILALAAQVRDAVRERFGVELEMEVRLVGEDPS